MLQKNGFSLLEVLLILLLVGIASVFAVQGIGTLTARATLHAATMQLLHTLNTARTEAKRNFTEVIVCSAEITESNTKCALKTGSKSDWRKDWLMYRNTASNTFTKNDTILKTGSIDSVDNIRIFRNGSSKGYMKFSAFLFDVGAQSISFALCHTDDDSVFYRITTGNETTRQFRARAYACRMKPEHTCATLTASDIGTESYKVTQTNTAGSCSDY